MTNSLSKLYVFFVFYCCCAAAIFFIGGRESFENEWPWFLDEFGRECLSGPGSSANSYSQSAGQRH
jgi:hypothetical protein